jgi:DNA processing protein
MKTEERMARMGLMAANDAGDLGLAALVRDQGAVQVWEYLRSGKGKTAISRRAASVNLDHLVEETKAISARFLIPGDEQWPTNVDALSWSDPVGTMGGEPLGLWVKGPANLAHLDAISIIGSRASTTYGEHVAADWAVALAERGLTIVSGGAYGIDACAHRGAIAAGGMTVAVMAGGLGQFYPSGNSALLEKVCERGAVVSEYPPGCPPSRSRFLVRNRLIAALSQATVIVEGALRSGAQNTVSWALCLARPVMAVPGPVTSAMSVTPHRLIRHREAILVSSVEEVLAITRPVDTSVPDYVREQPTRFDMLSASHKVLHDAMPVRRHISVDELSTVTGQSPSSVVLGLVQLQQLGFVTETPPGRWRLAGNRP